MTPPRPRSAKPVEPGPGPRAGASSRANPGRAGETGAPPRPGRPPLSSDEIEARVAHYCRRYSVVAGDNGLPPFPSGQRESRQHREWLTLYRARQRAARRAAAPLAHGRALRPSERATEAVAACAICGRALGAGPVEEIALPGRRRVRLHADCAELARTALAAGPDAVAAAVRLLWPRRA